MTYRLKSGLAVCGNSKQQCEQNLQRAQDEHIQCKQQVTKLGKFKFSFNGKDYENSIFFLIQRKILSNAITIWMPQIQESQLWNNKWQILKPDVMDYWTKSKMPKVVSKNWINCSRNVWLPKRQKMPTNWITIFVLLPFFHITDTIKVI